MITQADKRYWSPGIWNVPQITGAALVMDCADLRDAWRGLNLPWPIPGHTLDVGCGTGRLSAWCHEWTGADITADIVGYNAMQGRHVFLITRPESLPRVDGLYARIVALSVFTHIGLDDRAAYLHAFAERAPEVVVDIIPGAGSGNRVLWTCSQFDFDDIRLAAGFDEIARYDRTSPDQVTHRYFHLRRRG